MGTEPFQDVYEYIKLFTPVGWKADHLKWSDTVRKMFTEGYCFNFAKALKITFEHKYNCRIVGIVCLLHSNAVQIKLYTSCQIVYHVIGTLLVTVYVSCGMYRYRYLDS